MDIKNKKLKNVYSKQLKRLTKKFLKDNDKTSYLTCFISYLKYIRDSILLNTVLNTNESKTVLATLNTAIAEFEAYKNAKTAKEKKFHWANFCTFLNLNMEEWLDFNDSI
jgi:hypothetical protein